MREKRVASRNWLSGVRPPAPCGPRRPSHGTLVARSLASASSRPLIGSVVTLRPACAMPLLSSPRTRLRPSAVVALSARLRADGDDEQLRLDQRALSRVIGANPRAQRHDIVSFALSDGELRRYETAVRADVPLRNASASRYINYCEFNRLVTLQKDILYLLLTELLNNGDVSEIEDFDIDEDDFDLEPNILFALAAEEDCSSEEQDDKQDVIEDESSSIPESVVEPPEAPIIPPSIPSGRTTRTSRQGRSVSVSSSTQRSRVTCGRSSRGGAVSTLSTTRRRVWKQVPFEDGPHNYMPIPTKPVRRPVDYFRDYFDDDFIEKNSHCTNLYYL
ncbi:hypothetical protein EVAR_54860_1 [Eumeta japonica]|uniref:Uncharacterized protein n=1 Tax=Eumeta variegata TaxID=151549 RepID=A0A4C1YCR6_EUMVA|nr:hypothetical protein EVAR_54860_1 [Eumeta japonica]